MKYLKTTIEHRFDDVMPSSQLIGKEGFWGQHYLVHGVLVDMQVERTRTGRYHVKETIGLTKRPGC